MIIVCCSQKGGVGKTSLATSIAWELREQDTRVLIVDADPQGTAWQMAQCCKDAPETIHGDLLADPLKFRERTASYDCVCIDTPPTLFGDYQTNAISVADMVLIPMSHSAGDLWSAAGTIRVMLQAMNKRPKLKAGIVYNRKSPSTVLAKTWRDEQLSDCPLHVFPTEITYRVAWQEAMNKGMGVAQYAPKDKAASELKALLLDMLVHAGVLKGQAAVSKKEVANG